MNKENKLTIEPGNLAWCSIVFIGLCRIIDPNSEFGNIKVAYINDRGEEDVEFVGAQHLSHPTLAQMSNHPFTIAATQEVFNVDDSAEEVAFFALMAEEEDILDDMFDTEPNAEEKE